MTHDPDASAQRNAEIDKVYDLLGLCDGTEASSDDSPVIHVQGDVYPASLLEKHGRLTLASWVIDGTSYSAWFNPSGICVDSKFGMMRPRLVLSPTPTP